MKQVGFIFHPSFLKHDTGYSHFESSSRLEAIVTHLEQSPIWNQLYQLAPQAAALEWIQTIHPLNHIESIRQRCLAGERVLDSGDTHVCENSFDAALYAVGAVLLAVDEVLAGEHKIDSAFCAVRPPGHHAEAERVMGFCLFNNIAIGARYAQQHYGLERIAIIDWDVHHGNGTQWSFYSDQTILYISLHQYPFYPGSGAANDRGEGKGVGFNLNFPMQAGSTEQNYLEAFDNIILPALDNYHPELIMISAGFDAHKDDPLANIRLTEESFMKMTRMLTAVAAKYCNNKIVSVLEGGYYLSALAKSVEAHLQTLAE